MSHANGQRPRGCRQASNSSICLTGRAVKGLRNPSLSGRREPLPGAAARLPWCRHPLAGHSTYPLSLKRPHWKQVVPRRESSSYSGILLLPVGERHRGGRKRSGLHGVVATRTRVDQIPPAWGRAVTTRGRWSSSRSKPSAFPLPCWASTSSKMRLTPSPLSAP